MKNVIKILFLFLILSGANYSESLPDSSVKILNNLNIEEKLSTLQRWCWDLRFSDQVLALKYGRTGLNLAIETQNFNTQAKLNNFIGVIFLHQSDFNTAHKYFLEAKEIAEKHNIDTEIGYALNNIGHINIYKKDFYAALNSIKSSIPFHEKVNDINGIAYAYIRISEVYFGLQKYDSAYIFAKNALELRKTLGNKNSISRAKMTLGEALSGMGKYGEALEIFNEIIHEVPERSRILIRIAHVYLYQNDFDRSIRYLQDAFDLAKEKKNFQLMMESSELLAENFYKKKDFQNAYLYSLKIKDYRDSLFNEDKTKQMSFLEFVSQTESQRRKLQELDLESSRNKIIILYISLGFIVLGFFTFVLFYSRKKQKENYLILEDKNQEIILQSQKLHELNSTKDKFFSIIAHDLRNPLGSFKQITEYISHNFNNLTVEEQMEFINLMKNSSSQIYNLLENLLDWSRSQRGILVYQESEFNLFFIVNNTISNLHSLTSDKNIKIINKVPIELMVCSDVNMTSTIIRNLLTNAIKFSNKNENILISITNSDNENVTVSIKDNGTGMPKEILEKLFRIDFNHTSTGTSNEKGTGIGLILCKELTEKMGGKIWAESNLDQGSVFSFTLKKSN